MRIQLNPDTVNLLNLACGNPFHTSHADLEELANALLTEVAAARSEAATRWRSLTPRQKQVCALYAIDNLSHKEIASMLSIALMTVHAHVQNSYKKLAVHDRNDLLRLISLAAPRDEIYRLRMME